MNNRARTILLVVAIVAAIGAGFAVRSRTERSSDHAPLPLLPKAREQADRIARVMLKRGAVETVLERREGGWVVVNKSGYPADGERTRKMIADLLDSKTIEPKTSKPENYERIGVSEPDKPGAAGVRVELQDQSGQSLGAVIVGNISTAPTGEDPVLGGSRYFVRRPDEAQSWLAQGSLGFVVDPMSWVNRSPVEVDYFKVRTAVITHAEPSEVVAVSKQVAADTTFKFDSLPEGRQPKDEFAATRVAQAISGIVIDDVAPAADFDFSKPEVTAVFTTFEGQTIVARCVTREGRKWWAFEASYEAPPPPPPAPLPEDADEAAKAAAEKTQAEVEKQHQETTAALKKTEEMSARVQGWAFVLPEYKVKALTVRMEELLSPPPSAPLPPEQTEQAPEQTPAAETPSEPAQDEPREPETQESGPREPESPAPEEPKPEEPEEGQPAQPEEPSEQPE